jgi:hypothetical protein
MSRLIVMSFAFFAIVLPLTAFGASEVQVGGDFRLSSGNLIFSDGTTQTTAATGTGVSIGVTKVVHGLAGADGSTAATTFSVNHTGTGFYTITFTTSFSGAPTCVVTSVGHQTDSMGYVACELSSVPSTNSASISCFQYIPMYNDGNGTYYYNPSAIDTPFTLICVK